MKENELEILHLLDGGWIIVCTHYIHEWMGFRTKQNFFSSQNWESKRHRHCTSLFGQRETCTSTSDSMWFDNLKWRTNEVRARCPCCWCYMLTMQNGITELIYTVTHITHTCSINNTSAHCWALCILEKWRTIAHVPNSRRFLLTVQSRCSVQFSKNRIMLPILCISFAFDVKTANVKANSNKYV